MALLHIPLADIDEPHLQRPLNAKIRDQIIELLGRVEGQHS
jgi:hypothetical protein